MDGLQCPGPVWERKFLRGQRGWDGSDSESERGVCMVLMENGGKEFLHGQRQMHQRWRFRDSASESEEGLHGPGLSIQWRAEGLGTSVFAWAEVGGTESDRCFFLIE